MSTFVWSDRLEKLWDHICARGDSMEASCAFDDASHNTIPSGSTIELLNYNVDTLSQFSHRIVYVFEEDSNVFFFDIKSEVKAYNRVLRQWCENTDRKIRKKR